MVSALGVSGLATGALSAPSSQRFNILYIVSEDNGPEIECYGSPIKSPHLDALAGTGVRFTNAYVPQAGCSPSRASFLTGLYPHQNGQIGLATWNYSMYSREIPNVVTTLKKAGYRTGIIGKLHVNPENSFPFDFKNLADDPAYADQRNQLAQQLREWQEKTGDALRDPDNARRLFDMIQGTNLNREKKLPYKEFMDMEN